MKMLKMILIGLLLVTTSNVAVAEDKTELSKQLMQVLGKLGTLSVFMEEKYDTK